jgi:hypothetical protein
MSSNHYTMAGDTEITNWEFDPLQAPVGRLLDNGELTLAETTTPKPPLVDTSIYATNDQLYHAVLALAASSLLALLYPVYMALSWMARSCGSRHRRANTYGRQSPILEEELQQVYVNHPPIVPRCVPLNQ